MEFRNIKTLDVELNSLSADDVMAKYHVYDPSNPSEDRAVQSAKDDADINVMIKRFGLNRVAKPQQVGYYDLSELTDYQTSLNLLHEAERRFLEVPSQIRQRFNNDPGQFAAWIREDKNYEEAQKMGLVKPKPKEPAPMKVEVINPTIAPGA